MRSFKTSDGLTLAFQDQGEGTPVLCLAGLTRNSTDFDFFAKEVEYDGVRLIRLDSRGRGQSEFDPDYTNYTVPTEARDAIELLDYLNLPKAVIVGTSRGGLIAMLLAALAKDRLAGVLLNDIGPIIASTGLVKIKGYIGRDPSYQTIEDAVSGLPEFYAGSFANVPTSRWRECAQRWWNETPEGLKINYDPRLREAILEAEPSTDDIMWSLFDSLNGIPLAVVRGANSDLLSQETLDEMRRRRPDMASTNVADRGHVPFLDEPEVLAVFRTLLLRLDV